MLIIYLYFLFMYFPHFPIEVFFCLFISNFMSSALQISSSNSWFVVSFSLKYVLLNRSFTFYCLIYQYFLLWLVLCVLYKRLFCILKLWRYFSIKFFNEFVFLLLLNPVTNSELIFMSRNEESIFLFHVWITHLLTQFLPQWSSVHLPHLSICLKILWAFNADNNIVIRKWQFYFFLSSPVA